MILATDGDFNVGVSSDGALKTLIEEKRKSGIFLSVLGFGSTGNDKVMVEESGANLVTVASGSSICRRASRPGSGMRRHEAIDCRRISGNC